jgi:hypothetical protein
MNDDLEGFCKVKAVAKFKANCMDLVATQATTVRAVVSPKSFEPITF